MYQIWVLIGFFFVSDLTYGAQYEIEVFSSPRKTYEPILTPIKSTFTKSKFQFYKINESSVVVWNLFIDTRNSSI